MNWLSKRKRKPEKDEHFKPVDNGVISGRSHGSSQAGRGTGSSTTELTEGYTTLANAVYKSEKVLSQLEQQVQSLSKELDKLGKSVRKSDRGVRDLSSRIEKKEELLGSLENRIDYLGQTVTGLGDSFDRMRESLKAELAALQQMIGTLAQMQLPLPVDDGHGDGE